MKNNFKKKILIYFPSIEKGGVERNFFNLINDKQFSKKYNFKIITFNKDVRLKKFHNLTYSINKFFLVPRIIKFLICFIMLLKISRKNDIILSFQNSILSIVASKIKKSKVVIRLNTSPQKYITSLLHKKFFNYFYLKADYVICNSLDFKKEIQKYFSIKAIYINNFCDVNQIQKLAKKKIKFNFFQKFKGIKFISVGRLVDQKNNILSLIALNKIKNKINFRYLIIGSGVEINKLKNFIKMNNLNDKVKIIAYNNNPYKFMKMSDVFLLSSKFEGYPNVLLETILLKKFFISSNCPTGPKEIFRLRSNLGYLYKNNNSNSLLKTIEKTIYSKKYLKLKKINTEKIIKNKFGNNHKLIELLNKI